MSTIAPGDSRRIAAALAQRGIGFVDAPVTGSSPKAEDGTLTIMAGGAAEDFARARPLFEAMGELIVHVGDEVGQGEMVKLINNAVAAANAHTLAQALVVGRATGIDLDALAQVMGAGSGGSAMLGPQGGPDARARLRHPVQARAHAQGRAPVPRGGPGRGRSRSRPRRRCARPSRRAWAAVWATPTSPPLVETVEGLAGVRL